MLTVELSIEVLVLLNLCRDYFRGSRGVWREVVSEGGGELGVLGEGDPLEHFPNNVDHGNQYNNQQGSGADNIRY